MRSRLPLSSPTGGGVSFRAGWTGLSVCYRNQQAGTTLKRICAASNSTWQEGVDRCSVPVLGSLGTYRRALGRTDMHFVFGISLISSCDVTSCVRLSQSELGESRIK